MKKNYIILTISLFFLSFSDLNAETVPPEFLKEYLPKLRKSDEIEKLRSNSKKLDQKKQKELIEFYKKLDEKKDLEFELKIILAPYMASKLTYDEFQKITSFYVIEQYYSPPEIKYSLLSEIGHIAINEKSPEGKAFKFLSEMSDIPDLNSLPPEKQRMYFPNMKIFVRISMFLRLYRNIVKEIDKNKKSKEMLYACLENRLGNRPKRLFILLNSEDNYFVQEDGSYVMDSTKSDGFVEITNEYREMLVDVLSYSDLRIREKAVKELRFYTGQNYGFDPNGDITVQKEIIEKWRNCIKDHNSKRKPRKRTRRR